MSTVKTKTWKGNLSHLMANPEVKRVINNARKTAREDGYGYIVYEDEPGSVAYVRSCLYGKWDYQTEDKIIVQIVTYYE
jgi:hypothetical protein